MRFACLQGLLLFLLLSLPPGAVGATVDLAQGTGELDLTRQIRLLPVEPEQIRTPEEALLSPLWVDARNNMNLLQAPHQKSEIWLQLSLANSGAEPLQRWLEIAPWRVGHIDAWMLRPNTEQPAGHWQTGVGVSVAEREVKSTRAIIPLTLQPREEIRLLIKVSSFHRPRLAVTSWNPRSFDVSEQQRYQYHSIFLAIILTLFVVLLLQHNLPYFLIGCWMLALFALEAEKEGYISYLFFSELSNYGLNLRFISAILEVSLFLTITVYLMGLKQHRYWRWVTPGVWSLAVVASAVGFALDGVELRQLGTVLHLLFALLWLCMLPAMLKQGGKWRWLLLGLLALNWATTTLFVLKYALNIHYMSTFSSFRVEVKILVILGLMLIYALQKRDYERKLERQVREHERAEHERLERAVAQRTRELNQALDSLRRADEARTGFLSRVTHDLKSPLTSIMGYSQLLSGEQGRPGQLSHVIHNSASHMLNLINRLINYARDVTAVEAEDTDIYLHAFINSVTFEARILASRNNNSFKLKSDAQLPAVIRCDETLLREVLLNLIENAAKYTEHGVISLHLSGERRNGSEPGLWLVCEVEDSGCGIPLDRQDQMFEPFSRGEGKQEGLGLGLAIVKELVERMGGEISLNSIPDQGTCVRFAIPVKPGEEEAELAVLKTPEQMLPRYQAANLGAWVVEDAPAIRDLLQLELEELGFRVTCFQDAETAIKALHENGAPDLILTDYRLPGASGDRVLEEARAVDPQLPVLLLSATWYLQADQRSRSAAAQRYTAILGKPMDLARLRREIAAACGLQPSPATATSAAVHGDRPSVLDPATLEQLEHWLELGAVTDMVEWCEQLAQHHPELSGPAEELRQLAERGNFSAIRERLRSADFGSLHQQ